MSDGMSMGIPTLAEPFSNMTRGRGTRWNSLRHDPDTAHGYLNTDSLNSLVTDSAAAASAWASGSRINNGSLNMLPDGTRLTPIGNLLHDSGRKMGMVVTDAITGGSPGGMAAVQADRGRAEHIAIDYLDVVDLLMGGGSSHFDPLTRSDHQDVIDLYQTRGYRVVRNRSQVTGTSEADKLLGLFADSKLPYTIDHMADENLRNTIPTLAEMTRYALKSLSGSSNGFFLFVEGARIDHAAHINDISAALWEQLAFDDAVGVTLDFAADQPDTLILITTDHGNANPGLNGMGSKYSESDECFSLVSRATGSFQTLRHRVRDHVQVGQSPQEAAGTAVKKLMKIDLEPAEASVIGQALTHNTLPDELHVQQHNWVGVVSQVLGNHTGVGWTGVTHTADQVLLSAVGPGAEHFAGLHHHTDVYDILTDLLNIQHRNPKMQAASA
jgi:alkaline phosphatase